MSKVSNGHPRRVDVRWRLPIAIGAILAAGVVLAACGSSSNSGSATVTNSASTTDRASARSGRFAALRACLQKEGITLPSRPSSGGPPAGGSGLPGSGGGPRFQLPAGVSQAKLREALKKCGAGAGFAGRRRFNSAAGREGLAKFARCMRENGVNLPAPNTSGNGPVFNTKGIDTSSATFKNARTKCQSNLRGAFGGGQPPAGGQAGPPAGGEGGPPAGGGEAPTPEG